PGGTVSNAPDLDVTVPEDGNNREYAGIVAYFLSTPHYGTHELKAGAERFVSTGIGGNSQSSTGSVFIADYATTSGSIVRDASGTPVPVWVPGVSQVWTFQATRGAKVNIATNSFYVQDRWVATPRL